MKTKIKITNTSFFEKLIEKSKSIYARSLLYFFSFIEAIFFPIPVDPLLAILVLNNKQKYIELTIFCTLASVIGGSGIFNLNLGNREYATTCTVKT